MRHGLSTPVLPARQETGWPIQWMLRRCVGLNLAVPLTGIDHRPADAVLDAPQRIEALELRQDSGLRAAAIRFNCTNGVSPMH